MGEKGPDTPLVSSFSVHSNKTELISLQYDPASHGRGPPIAHSSYKHNSLPKVGAVVGTALGTVLGTALGTALGAVVGAVVGAIVGAVVGFTVGIIVGCSLFRGKVVGSEEEEEVGPPLVGISVAVGVGAGPPFIGVSVGVGSPPLIGILVASVDGAGPPLIGVAVGSAKRS